jgi:two-component system response regulator BaeR
MHIMVVEDERELAELVRDYLVQAGYTVSVYGHGTEALAAARRQPPDLMVLDLMLPGMDGLVVCREVRQFSSLPIIMVTARSEEVDRLLGLEIGADDYLCKPFSPRELVARIRAILRRSLPQPSQGLILDAGRQTATMQGKRLNLTPTEYRLLALFMAHHGQVFSRARLLDEANPDNLDVADRVIDSHIKNLRRKLSDSANRADRHDWVVSVYGVGYRFEWPE